MKRAGKQVLEELVIGIPRPDKREAPRRIDFWLTVFCSRITRTAISEALGSSYVSRRL